MTAVASLRVKRNKQTIFVVCHLDDGDTPRTVKDKLSLVTGVVPDRLRLWVDARDDADAAEPDPAGRVSVRKVLDDDRALADQGVANDHVLYMVFRRENGSWEDVEVPEYRRS